MGMSGIIDKKNFPPELLGWLDSNPRPRSRRPGLLAKLETLGRLKWKILLLEDKIREKCSHANSDLVFSIECEEEVWNSTGCLSPCGDRYSIKCNACGTNLKSVFIPDPRSTTKIIPAGNTGMQG